MAKKSIGMKVLNVLAGLLIALALVSIGTITFLDGFNIIQWLSFGMKWVEYILAGIIGAVGVIGVISLLYQTFMK